MLNIPYVCLAAADGKSSSREWCDKLFGSDIAVMFTTSHEVAQEQGFDRKGGKFVRCEFHPDLSSTRLPSYTPPTKRKIGTTNADDDAGTTYEVAVADFLTHLRTAKPASFYVEVDPAYKRACTPAGDSAMKEFMQLCKTEGYSLMSFQAAHRLWTEGLPRISMFICGFNRLGGGGAAARWVQAALQPLLESQHATGPCNQIWCGASEGLLGILEVGAGYFDIEDEFSAASLINLDS